MNPGTTLTADLPCHRCGYNLRGLASDSRCPECGEAIAHTLAAANPTLNQKAAHWFNQLALGALLLSAAALVGFFFVPLSPRLNGSPDSAAYLFTALASWLAAAGTWLLAYPNPARVQEPGDGSFPPIFRLFSIAPALAATLLLMEHSPVTALHLSRWVEPWVGPIVGIFLLLMVAACALAVFPATFFIHLRLWYLASRIKSRSLRIQSIFYALMSLAIMVISTARFWKSSLLFVTGVGFVGGPSPMLAADPPLLDYVAWIRAGLPVWAICLFTFAAFRFRQAGRQARPANVPEDSSTPAKQIETHLS